MVASGVSVYQLFQKSSRLIRWVQWCQKAAFTSLIVVICLLVLCFVLVLVFDRLLYIVLLLMLLKTLLLFLLLLFQFKFSNLYFWYCLFLLNLLLVFRLFMLCFVLFLVFDPLWYCVVAAAVVILPFCYWCLFGIQFSCFQYCMFHIFVVVKVFTFLFIGFVFVFVFVLSLVSPFHCKQVFFVTLIIFTLTLS
mgnify:CR=1 FL=1